MKLGMIWLRDFRNNQVAVEASDILSVNKYVYSYSGAVETYEDQERKSFQSLISMSYGKAMYSEMSPDTICNIYDTMVLRMTREGKSR